MPVARRRSVLAALLLVTAPAAAALAPGDVERRLTVGGLERRYLLHVPPRYDGRVPVPLVLDLHGFTSNAIQQRGLSGMLAVADREGFLLAHPDGVNNAWNAGICCGNRGVDDVAFLRAVVAAIRAEGNVDARRVYATGLSNGGAMSQRLACDAADVFAAAAPLAFPLPFAPLSSCRPARAIPVLTFMGLTDELVAYEGGPFPSAPDTIAYWREVDGCRGTAPDETVVAGASRCETWTRCAGDVAAGLCSITARSFGNTSFDGHVLYLNDDLVLADVAWAFLSRFRLPETLTTVRAGVRGVDRLRVRGARAAGAPFAWTVTLGGGTWSAEGEDGLLLSGAARRRGSRVVLSLTSAARDELQGRLARRLSAGAGRRVRLVAAGRNRLVASVDRGRGRVRLSGRIVARDADGAGSVTLRLRGVGRLERS
jgi:polyhydroxybutyrate depolymerase